MHPAFSKLTAQRGAGELLGAALLRHERLGVFGVVNEFCSLELIEQRLNKLRVKAFCLQLLTQLTSGFCRVRQLVVHDGFSARVGVGFFRGSGGTHLLLPGGHSAFRL